eukprot:CAMPEP_0198323824 /NCGR_PEP_ID=MMETSP1450-20131203/11968_1 /TAXON_ID=753684 ORGANISM="Madagascaria erythrocladiodes, Strain CCMP3234" /NCGR_SAMPLE_ID=MMETSP1450 /ASSEMBLY_ACC=CAM_ASM_001115 /LENGTH=159 /DNA_ID=CAMNT_0044027565 /DNA_START=186 /DNA_END=662 /DNA_ORIENTATION=+
MSLTALWPPAKRGLTAAGAAAAAGTDDAEYVLVYVTASDRAEAQRLAESAVEQRLAACANVLGGTTQSVYVWNGEVETSAEVSVLFKTRSLLVDELSAHVVAAHSYDTPCVVAVPIVGGSAPFLDWIGDNTLDPPPPPTPVIVLVFGALGAVCAVAMVW